MTQTATSNSEPTEFPAQIDRAYLQRLIAREGSKAAAARALGWPVSTLKSRLEAAESTLYETTGPNGEARLQWVKYPAQRPEADKREDTLAVIREAMMELRGTAAPLPSIKRPTELDTSTLTTYVLTDHHLMMLSWAPETGENYDMKIAKDTLKDTMGRLVARTPSSERALLLNLGDFFHATDDSARTPLHQHQLDTDGRFSKALRMGVQLHVWAIELLLQHHGFVEVRILAGNHDPYASDALAVALMERYHNHPYVYVHNDPSLFFQKEWGKTLIAAHHGHTMKPERFAQAIPAYWPKEWGRTEHRYALLGHVHHTSRAAGEGMGVTWETFPTMAAKDAYARNAGFTSTRSMTAITYHKEEGEIGRTIEKVRKE